MRAAKDGMHEHADAFPHLHASLPSQQRREQLAHEFLAAADNLKTWYDNHETRKLCQALFDETPAPGQVDIIEPIAYGTHDRVAISAMTRYGKTWSLALALGLRFIFDASDLLVPVVAAKLGQAKKMRRYFADIVNTCPLLAANLLMSPSGVERLKKEVSKKRLTFRDGKELVVHTAHGKAAAIMGEGGDIVVIDESALIDTETYQDRVRRMAGDDPENAQIVELSNPWSRQTEFHDSWTSPRYHTVQIGWQQALQEGRTTRDWITEQRERLDPISFQVQYASEFPDDVEDALYKWAWIQHAVRRTTRDKNLSAATPQWGLDVAEGGADLNVLTRATLGPGWTVIHDQWSWSEENTMTTVRETENHVPREDPIGVDAIGIGKPVSDRLDEKGYNVQRFKASRSKSVGDGFQNLKAEAHWHVRDLLEKGATTGEAWISLPENSDLLGNLQRARYDVRNGTTRVHYENEDNDSPDYADSLVIAACRDYHTSTGSVGAYV
jgi:hypothetical protein